MRSPRKRKRGVGVSVGVPAFAYDAVDTRRCPYYVRSMIRRRITTTGNSAALVLSQDVLGLMNVGVGDEVELSLVDRTLVVRPLGEAERNARVASAIDDVFRRRRGALRRLAEGAGATSTTGRRTSPRRAR